MNKKNKIIMAVLIAIAVIMGAGITSYAVKTSNENKKATTTESTTTEPSTEATTEPTTASTTAQTTAKTTVVTAVANTVVTTTEATTEQTTASTTEGTKYATMEQYNKIQKGVTTYEEACEIFGFEGTLLQEYPELNCVEYMWATGTGRFRIAFIDNVVGTGLFDKMVNQ